MSTSLLYHAFGVRDHRYLKTEYVGGEVIFTIERKAETSRCAVCGSENVWRQGVVTRTYRAIPIGPKRVTLKAEIPRLLCHDCGKTRQAAIGFASPRLSYTKSFERYALELSQHMTIKDVAEHLGVSWDVEVVPIPRTGEILKMGPTPGAVSCQGRSLSRVASPLVEYSPRSSRKRRFRCCWTVTLRGRSWIALGYRAPIFCIAGKPNK